MLSINKTTRIFFIKLRQFTLAALLVYASGVQADALDVYMGTGTSSASETHPNVLFILDTSGSMGDEIEAIISALSKFALYYSDEDVIKWGLLFYRFSIHYLVCDVSVFVVFGSVPFFINLKFTFKLTSIM